MTVVHIMAGLGEANGIANIARRLAAAQRRNGDAPTLIAPRAKWNPIFFTFEFCRRAVRLARAADEIWVHGSWTFPIWFGALLARRFGRRLVVVPEGSFDPRRLNNASRWKKRLVAPFDRAVLRAADEVLALCAAEMDWVRAFEPAAKVRPGRVPTFYDGVTPRAIAARGRAVHVLFLGRAEDPLKGVRFLRAAVDELNAATPDAPRFDLRVERAVFGAEKEAAWAWCDVFCLPTLSENYGLVVAEALEHGVPVVITTDGAPVWRDAPLTYLAGYLAASDAQRVIQLKTALSQNLPVRAPSACPCTSSATRSGTATW